MLRKFFKKFAGPMWVVLILLGVAIATNSMWRPLLNVYLLSKQPLAGKMGLVQDKDHFNPQDPWLDCLLADNYPVQRQIHNGLYEALNETGEFVLIKMPAFYGYEEAHCLIPRWEFARMVIRYQEKAAENRRRDAEWKEKEPDRERERQETKRRQRVIRDLLKR